MAFIVFEGLDGSGKTSLIKRLEEELSKLRINYILTREPGGTPLAEEVREILLRTKGETPVPRTEVLLYQAGRSQHVEKVIRPALENKKWVICDRFTASTVAFQVGGRHLLLEDIQWLNNYATDGLTADLTVLLDISVDLSFSRQQKRIQTTGQQADRFENEAREFHEKVRNNYLSQAKLQPTKWLVLDSQENVDQLSQKLISSLREKKWLS